MKLEGRVPAAIDERQAALLARDLYAFEATARALPGEYDDNFHLVAPDGGQRVLKVMHPARERSLIELQSAALEHIALRAPGVSLPRVCRTRDEATIATVEDAGAHRLVWMLTYVAGRPLTPASSAKVPACCCTASSIRWSTTIGPEVDKLSERLDELERKSSSSPTRSSPGGS